MSFFSNLFKSGTRRKVFSIGDASFSSEALLFTRNLLLPDKDGTVALVDDCSIFVPRIDTWNNFKADFVTMSVLSSSSKKTIRLAPGDYNLDGIINLSPGHNINLQGCKFTRRVSNSGFLLSGSISSVQHNLIEDLNNANRPNNTNNTPYELARVLLGAGNGATYDVDDYILIYSNQAISGTNDDGVPGFRGSIRRIESKSGDSLQIEPIWWNASIADTARVREVNFVEGGNLVGGEFVDNSTVFSTPNLRPYFQFYLVKNQKFS